MATNASSSITHLPCLYICLPTPSAPPSHALAMAEPLLQAWLSSFEAALLQRDVEAALQLFHPDECFWRDLLAFTWNIYTSESQHEIIPARDPGHAPIRSPPAR